MRPKALDKRTVVLRWLLRLLWSLLCSGALLSLGAVSAWWLVWIWKGDRQIGNNPDAPSRNSPHQNLPVFGAPLPVSKKWKERLGRGALLASDSLPQTIAKAAECDGGFDLCLDAVYADPSLTSRIPIAEIIPVIWPNGCCPT